ncbi:hypothetical protein BDV33DRAFT_175480, partial [Aspergillus novoparasiticus]
GPRRNTWWRSRTAYLRICNFSASCRTLCRWECKMTSFVFFFQTSPGLMRVDECPLPANLDIAIWNMPSGIIEVNTIIPENPRTKE